MGRVCSQTSHHTNVYTPCVCVSCDLVGVTVDRGWGQRLISSVWDVPRLTLETLSIDSKSIDLALLPKLMITNVRYVRFLGTPHFTSVSVLLTRTGLFFTVLLCGSLIEWVRYLFSMWIELNNVFSINSEYNVYVSEVRAIKFSFPLS